MSILCRCIMETKVIPVLIVKMFNLSGGRQMAPVGIHHGIRQWSCLAAGRGSLLLLLLQGIGVGAGIGALVAALRGIPELPDCSLRHQGLWDFRTDSANLLRIRMHLSRAPGLCSSAPGWPKSWRNWWGPLSRSAL